MAILPIGKKLARVECGRCDMTPDSFYWGAYAEGEETPFIYGWGDSFAYVCRMAEPYYNLLRSRPDPERIAPNTPH